MDIRGSLSLNDSQTQLQAELKTFSPEERQDLLKSAGITINIPPEQGLAIKADLAIPWNKLRVIRRYNVEMYYIQVQKSIHKLKQMAHHLGHPTCE